MRLKNKEKFMVLTSAIYLVMAVAASIAKPFPHAVEAAQAFYVLALAAPFLIPAIGKRVL